MPKLAYRRFIPNFAKIAGPLYLLKKQNTPFFWTLDCETSFCKLKELLVSSPVLSYPNFECPFVLSTDASGAGLGPVLEQEGDGGLFHPVAYICQSDNLQT